MKPKLLSWNVKALNEGKKHLRESCSENGRQTLFVFRKLNLSICLVALCIACGVIIMRIGVI
jgi:hypothetical protein